LVFRRYKSIFGSEKLQAELRQGRILLAFPLVPRNFAILPLQHLRGLMTKIWWNFWHFDFLPLQAAEPRNNRAFELRQGMNLLKSRVCRPIAWWFGFGPGIRQKLVQSWFKAYIGVGGTHFS